MVDLMHYPLYTTRVLLNFDLLHKLCERLLVFNVIDALVLICDRSVGLQGLLHGSLAQNIDDSFLHLVILLLRLVGQLELHLRASPGVAERVRLVMLQHVNLVLLLLDPFMVEMLGLRLRRLGSLDSRQAFLAQATFSPDSLGVQLNFLR